MFDAVVIGTLRVKTKIKENLRVKTRTKENLRVKTRIKENRYSFMGGNSVKIAFALWFNSLCSS